MMSECKYRCRILGHTENVSISSTVTFWKMEVCNSRIRAVRIVGDRWYRPKVSTRTIWAHFDITTMSLTTPRVIFTRKTEFLGGTLIPRFDVTFWGFSRIVTTMMIRGRWYRSKVFLCGIVRQIWCHKQHYNNHTALPEVISKCWRNPGNPLRTKYDLRWQRCKIHLVNLGFQTQL